ncbi:MAG TPA: hypothetical protein VMN79_04290 [Casimicrobiaceae bacterium]|nr:hypothetical protein [Casimicrobiaceae bacterium]
MPDTRARAPQGSPTSDVRKVAVGRGLRVGLQLALLAIALARPSVAAAETRVYLLRGWFNVFSTGMDGMAEALRAKGIDARVIGHLAWKSATEEIVSDEAAGKTLRLVFVGHSQGANNAIDMARELQSHGIAIDLLITLAPFMQNPVPANVVRAVNYYQSPGWGSALTADADFKGDLSNVNIAGEVGVFHITIDKDSRIQAQVLAAIAALPR